MMKTTKLHKLNEKKGVVVLFALLITALLSILALAFTITSITNKETAKSYRDLTAARMFAQAGLRRVISGMKLYGTYENKDFADIYSNNQEAISDTLKREDLGGSDGLLKTVVDAVTYYTLGTNYDVDDNPTWLYIPFDHGVDTPIIGRIAYVVVSSNGKIDPSACIDSGYNAYIISGHPGVSEADKPGSGGGGPGNAYDGRDGLGYEKTSVDADGNFVTGRPGRELSEVFLRTMDDDESWFNADPSSKKYAQKISTHWASPAGQLGSGNTWTGRWLDFDTLFDQLKVKDEYKDYFRNFFTLDSPPDPEAFWLDNADLIKTTGELYHRFDLKRSNWNDVTVDSIKADPINYENAYAEDSVTSIPWLGNWKSAGEMGSATAAKNQIVANLIDYNDTNSIATTDSEDNPTYVGLEKCPYINEIKMEFEGEVQEVENTGVYNYTCNAYLKQITVELVDMYDTGALNTTATVTISGTYRWSPNPDGNDTDVAFEKTIPIDISAASSSYGSTTYNVVDSDISPTNNTNNGIGQTARSITNLQINSLAVKLINKDDSDFYDYSKILENPSAAQTLSSNGTLSSLYFDAQINDPRQNLLENDWADSEFSTSSSIGTTASPYTNATFNPNPGGNTDSEPGVSDPWELSTAFVRNEKMESPWELGFIHRGSKWQTINLKIYNTTESYSGGGNNYQDGDANILDQIKMAPETEVYGKINLNTDLKPVLKALFQKIRVGSDIKGVSSTDGPGALTKADGSEADEVTATIANAFADDVLDHNYTNAGAVYYTRAQLLRDTDPLTNTLCYDGTIVLNRDNDATQEEIIGKFINLTKASGSPNELNVIVIAQTIKDVGVEGTTNTIDNNGVSCQTGRYDQGGDLIVATQKILTTVTRTSDDNTFRIRRFEYLDE